MRELGELARAAVVVDPAELASLDTGDGSPTARRNVAILNDLSARGPERKSHRIELRFGRSPVEVLGDGDGPVTAQGRPRVKLVRVPQLLAAAAGG